MAYSVDHFTVGVLVFDANTVENDILPGANPPEAGSPARLPKVY